MQKEKALPETPLILPTVFGSFFKYFQVTRSSICQLFIIFQERSQTNIWNQSFPFCSCCAQSTISYIFLNWKQRPFYPYFSVFSSYQSCYRATRVIFSFLTPTSTSSVWTLDSDKRLILKIKITKGRRLDRKKSRNHKKIERILNGVGGYQFICKV